MRLEIELTDQQYNDWYDLTLKMKNINIMRFTYTKVNDEEVGALISAVLQQPEVIRVLNESRRALDELKK